MTLAVGHRGVPHLRPENTMPSFAEALKLGVDMIELDVQLTRDGQIVVIHDEAIDRTSNGHGALRARTLAELKALDFGSWYNPSFADERIPTLAEVIDLVRGKAELNIELKTSSAIDPGFEKQLLAEVDAAGFTDSCIFSCFDHYAVRTLAMERPGLRLGVLYAAGTGAAVELARWAGAHALHPFFPFVNPELVAEAHRNGMQVNTWTVDDPAIARQFVALGVDAIISNSPEVLKQVKAAQR